MMSKRKYLEYLINPFELIKTKQIVQVNPTIIAERKQDEASQFYVFEYDTETLIQQRYDKLEDCFKHRDTEQISWINVDGIKKEEVESIADVYQIHPLIVEDILSGNQRAKMEEINGLVFCVLNMIAYDETHQIITTEQVSLVLGDRFVISFQEDAASDVFNGLREKIKIKGSKIRNNKADFLFYCLLDAIVDHYFVVMEKTGEKIQILEENMGVGNDQESLHSINALRKDLILLKRSVNPVRDLISGILRSDTEWIEEKTMKYFKDVHDHIIQANELVENYRDMVVNTHDLYMNNINLRLNESMKVMTIVTCLLAPATVIGGIFGMNFEVIPYMHDKRGFFLASGVMVVIPIFMFLYFRKKKWF